MTEHEKDLQTKTFDAFEIKDAEKGEVEAIVATLDVVDKDQEVIKSGAIASGAKIKLSEWGHNSVGMFGSPRLPVGKGVIQVENGKAFFRGKFFLSTQHGADAFRVVKEMGGDQQWSIGYRIIGVEMPDEEWQKKGAQRILTKLEVFEVSPVGIGAAIGTRTVAVKCEGCGQPQEGEMCAPCKAKADAKAAEDKATVDAVAAKQAAETISQRAEEEYKRFQRTKRSLGG